jgi:hypothetical protein
MEMDKMLHFVKIAGQPFTLTEFQRIPKMLNEGNVNAALTVLLAVRDDIANGEERIADLTLTEYINEAINTVCHWYSDMYCNPVTETIMQAPNYGEVAE